LRVQVAGGKEILNLESSKVHVLKLLSEFVVLEGLAVSSVKIFASVGLLTAGRSLVWSGIIRSIMRKLLSLWHKWSGVLVSVGMLMVDISLRSLVLMSHLGKSVLVGRNVLLILFGRYSHSVLIHLRILGWGKNVRVEGRSDEITVILLVAQLGGGLGDLLCFKHLLGFHQLLELALIYHNILL